MTIGKFALGALIGAAAGLVAGILTAPKSGKETRADLKAKADELKIDINESDFEDVDTIGGLMAQKLGRVPIAGSTVSLHGWSITSERPLGRRRRISSVLIERLEKEIEDHE